MQNRKGSIEGIRRLRSRKTGTSNVNNKNRITIDRRVELASVVEAQDGSNGAGAPLLLIDHRNLIRSSLLNLIEAQALGFRACCFSKPCELPPQYEGECGQPALIVFNVGASRVISEQTAAAISYLKRQAPNSRLILLSDREDAEEVGAALRLGVQGFIPVTLDPEVAIEALRLVRAGGIFVPVAAMVEAMAERARSAHPSYSGLDGDGRVVDTFSSKQLAVLQLLSEGLQNKMIAHRLNIRETTVKLHVRNILRKLNARNRTEAVYRARDIMPAATHV
jgi:DNA-binding NarL/FixJ family response regulator